jgi:hypothetical protein
VKGKGLREQSTQSAAGKLYYPEAGEPAGENVSKFQFRVISGYNPNANYAPSSVVPIKIQFEKGGVTYTAAFDVRVVSHTKSDEKIVFEAVNVRRWRISGTPLDMPAGEPVTITSVRGGGGTVKKPAKPAAKK